MGSWDTIAGPPVSDSLRKRALKRKVHQIGNRRWVCSGDAKLGDSYDQYIVTLNRDSRLECECSTHYGGQYRKFCSHALATLYFRQANPDEVYDEPRDKPGSAQDVDGGGLDSLKNPPIHPPFQPSPSTPAPTTPALVPYKAVSIAGQNPQDLPSPILEPAISDKFASFRDHQSSAIEQIVDLFNQGYKVVMLEAPTGTGKTLISEAVRRLIERKGVYTCTTKSLQVQVLDDFTYAKVLKGRVNYPTFDDSTVMADVCNKGPALLPACPKCPGWDKRSSQKDQPDNWDDESIADDPDGIALHCHFCHSPRNCPYEIAKGEALRAPLAILNTAYLLAEANGPGMFSRQDYVILDEADMLEGQLMSNVEVSLTQHKRDKLYIGEPRFITKEESWVEWIQEKVIPAVKADLNDLRGQLKSKGPTPTLLKAVRSNTTLAAKLNWLVRPTEEGDINMSGWVLSSFNGTLTFKPVRVTNYGQDLLWAHSKRFLLMSATIVSPEQMAADLGLEEGEWATVNVPSTFPIERRPVLLQTVGALNKETKEWSYPAVADRIAEIVSRHPDERILVHTVSYELNKIIHKRLRHSARVITYYQASDREAALTEYLDTPNSILLSPSFERGVDLPHDACRIVIVAKIPFPYLGDKQIAARTYGTHDGQMWYCVAPDTPILTTDLDWVPASKIHQGQRVMAFDEDGPWRKWRTADVEGIANLTRPSYLIHLADGSTLTSSAEHKWLVRDRNEIYWETTESLAQTFHPSFHPNRKHPKSLIRLLDVWEEDMSRDAGYLAGLFDGEGSISQISSYQQSNRLQLAFSQKEGIVSRFAEEALAQRGFDAALFKRPDSNSYQIRGGRSEILRLLGEIRPLRLLDKLDLNLLGMIHNIANVPIVRVEYLGEQEVVAIQTSERTFIANGFASHNSVQTIRTLCQMTGRGMRSADDWCISYILDKSFHSLYSQNKRLFPDWWSEAVVWDENDPKWKDSIHKKRVTVENY